MSRHFIPIVIFLAGLTVVVWVGAGYVAVNPLALAVTLVIGAFYAGAALELHRYRQATDTLEQAVADLSESTDLEPWLARLHPGLRDAVRPRVHGSRAALPGPAMTPYVVGLLVLLGMLGTFLGMIATLRGTGAALAGATDLQAIRTSLAAPVLGLGFAFGTSVAGVATSAALGLLAAWCRREREQAARRLDGGIAVSLQAHTPARQREEVLTLLRGQAELMPALVDRLHAMTQVLEQQSQVVSERLQADQQDFHAKAEAAYARLADSVAKTLAESVAESVAGSARAAHEAIQPALQTAMADLSRETASWQTSIAQTAGQQLADVSARFDAATVDMTGAWREAIDSQSQANRALAEDNQRALSEAVATLASQGDTLLSALDASHAKLRAELAAQERERLDVWQRSLDGALVSLRQELAQAAQAVAVHTREQASATLAEISRLAQTAAEAPQAAAEVIGELRQRLSDSLAHDNAVLQERNRLLETLDMLLNAVNHASVEQRAAIDGLVASSADMLERVGARFADTVQTQAGRLESAAVETASGAVEVASLSEAFGAAVQAYGQSNDKLAEHLERVGAALAQSASRSDEQLAYYVAQAREVVDLSLMAQKQIMEDLQRLADSKAVQGAGAA